MSVRFATLSDIDKMKHLYRKCFSCKEDYLEYFFSSPIIRHLVSTDTAGKVVATLAAFQLEYVSDYPDPSADEFNFGRLALSNFHCEYKGFYLYGLCTDSSARQKGHATALLRFFEKEARREGWDFLCLQPADGCPELVGLYDKAGFTQHYFRRHNLPLHEVTAGITEMHTSELFLLRQRTFQKDYFRWSAPILQYIIGEARLNPCHETDLSNIYLQMLPLNPEMKITRKDIIFSYPMG
ncbi:MAG: GNAT family N-acetyltransferase [Bacteroidales bacterium]|nr:GNAT family N-acetyltransferase [Bacteroidales bacterium]